MGVTGTRVGMNENQFNNFVQILEQYRPIAIHHGDAIGVDEAVHEIAYASSIPIFIHPPNQYQYRAFCDNAYKVYDEKAYLERNKDIVLSSSILVGFPLKSVEMQRSGTWACIRYARKLAKPILILWPSGKITSENIEYKAA